MDFSVWQGLDLLYAVRDAVPGAGTHRQHPQFGGVDHRPSAVGGAPLHHSRPLLLPPAAHHGFVTFFITPSSDGYIN